MDLKIFFSGTFLKAQCSSIISTVADFVSTIFLTEVVGLWYLLSSSLGAFIGGSVNFLLGRSWVFNAQEKNGFIQAVKYVVVWTGSIFLNSAGVYLFTDLLHVYYILSKTIVALFVGIFYNFSFQKSFVFCR